MELSAVSPFLQDHLDTILKQEALQALLVNTMDGVPLAKAMASTCPLPIEDCETFLPAIHGTTVEHTSKLPIGTVHSMVSIVGNVVIIHVHCTPLILTLVAPMDRNTGSLISTATSLLDTFEPVRKALESGDTSP